MINNSNIEEVKKLLKKTGDKIILAQNEEFNRKILEYGKFDILLAVELNSGKDKIRQIDSGLNHVLVKIATKNKVAIGFDLERISKLPSKDKAQTLSKVIQNIQICRKAKTKVAVKTSSVNKARDFLLSVKASTNQIKEAIVF
jgi:RNase P/RNase MRP subunit p30